MELTRDDSPLTFMRLPGLAVHACRFDHALAVPDDTHGLPQDLQDAAPRRIAEYLAGRHCAAQALAAQGEWRQEVGTGPGRELVWAPGWVGSISYEEDWAAAAVAATSRYRSVGIDVEPAMPASTRAEVGALIADAGEYALAIAAFADEALALALLFSVKESLYQALAPRLDGEVPDFLDALVLQCDADAGTVSIALAGPMQRALGAELVDGHFLRLDERTLLTIVALPAEADLEAIDDNAFAAQADSPA
jgi:enterobactin synthetase component D